MIHAGLTGGIATGKSTVSKIFRKAGAFIIDADKIAHDSVRKEKPAWREIVSYFGKTILRADGEIDRTQLGSLVFNDDGKKQALNRIVHPQVRLVIDRQMATIERDHSGGAIILDVPLLIEVGWHRGLEEVILVYAPENIQLKRLIRRDRLSYKDARARIRAQMPIEKKREHASIIIDNSDDFDTTRERTLAVYNDLVEKEKK